MINTLKKLFASKAFKILLLVLFILQLLQITYRILGVDAGAILPASRDVVKYGIIPYTGLYTIYSPLSYYCYGILYLFYEIPSMVLFSRKTIQTALWGVFLVIPFGLFSFNTNPHYIFMVAPYMLMLFTRIVVENNLISTYFNLSQIRITVLILVFVVSGSFYILRNHLYADTFHIIHLKDAKEAYQRSEADLVNIKEIIGKNKKIYLGDGTNKMFVYRLGLESINSKEIGYIFLYNSCLDSAFSRYASDDSKLLRSNELKSYTIHD